MSHPDALDLGPLTWVKTEIDLALARADESLDQALGASGGAACVQFAQTHLHQACGALSIVGLDGLSQFASSLDQLLGMLAHDERPIDASTVELARRALATIGNYLEELVHGTPDQPLRLLSLYEEIGTVRGAGPLSPAELFFPDLSLRPARRGAAPAGLNEDVRQQQLRTHRALFQRGLLQWLRTPADAAGPHAMLAAVGEIEALHTGTPVGVLWYAAQAFLETLIHQDLPARPEIKRLCSQLDAQLKRLSDIPVVVPDRLVRELLYWTSQAPARSAHQKDVRATWRLDALLPQPGATVSAAPLAALLKTLQGLMSAAKQAWDGFAEGQAVELPRFDAHLAELAAQASRLGRPALDRLLRGIAEFIAWLRKDPLRCSDPIALEVATALLLCEAGLERGAPAAGFSAHVDDTVARLEALARGEPVPAAERSPATETARRAQERDALGQLAREILSSLAQVEQVLDDFFRNEQKRTLLASLAKPLGQIAGAFALIGDAPAVALVEDAAGTVARLADAGQSPDQGEHERLARRLSALGFYVEALQHGPAQLERFLDPQDVEETLVPAPAPAGAQSAEPAASPPAAAAAADLDAELLAIFIEEAHEVLATIGARLDLSSSDADAREHLVAIRRGFHTLKGSGRMVGLHDLGETAWEIEQTLNRWLQLEWTPSSALHRLIDAARTALLEWVRDLEAGRAQARDVAALVAEAQHLRSDESEDLLAGLEIESSVFDFGDLPGSDSEAPLLPFEPEVFNFAPGASFETAAGAPDAGPDEPAALPAAAEREVVRIGAAEISRPLYDLYVGEARQHLAVLHAELARLEANPTLIPAEEALRAAHTLAGISGTTRLTPLHELARGLEHALERLRDTAQEPTAEQAALLKSANDTLGAMLAEVVARRMPLAVPELVEQLDDVGRETPLETGTETERAPSVRGLASHDNLIAAQPADAGSVPSGPGSPVHDELDAQLLPVFLDEGAELLGELHAALRQWRSDGAADAAQSTARLLHTLKGSARMAGAMTLGQHVHHLESQLVAALEGGQEPAGGLIDELTAGLDQAEQLIDAIAGGGPAQPAPAPDDAAPATSAGQDGASGAATLRVRADAVDRFVNQAGEIGITRTRVAGELRTLRRSLLDLTENVIRLRNQLREVELQADVQMQSRLARSDAHDGAFDPLEMDRYTRLQELTRMMAESVGDVTTVQQSLLRNLDGAELALNSQARLSRNLQQALMQVRMVPFDSLADRLYRVVRQSAKELGKRADLDLRGGRIEIDRSVLEHLVAPLEHLLRNAVAHGIEHPDARRAAGKGEIGQITLSVSQEGNEIAIALADDGGGLDYGRIAERARASGLLGADEAADEWRLTNLIFIPGFSTADSVSPLAGRGVGMDVVKSETAAAGGRIDVHSEVGRGTEFRLHLPLTLAVTQALLVRAGSRTYAIPSSMIAQVLELKAEPLDALRRDGGTEWQGRHFAYRYLPQLLGERFTQPPEQRFNWVLLLRIGAQTLALHVDALRGNQEIVVKNAGPQLVRIVGISGATVLGDGEIVLILNPVALASRRLAEGTATAANAGGEAPEPLEPFEAAPVRAPTVMVVDDSLTVRKITGRLLEREGYRVVAAKDGVDALERLLEAVPDVILSDIEMPRMDGFDLLRNIRADERTRDVPVIMITSRLADKHREYAGRLGANHYLGKPYDEDELLGLLRTHTGRAAVPAWQRVPRKPRPGSVSCYAGAARGSCDERSLPPHSCASSPRRAKMQP
ncbi:Hpt domain-containing protein [Aromatoleum anaerobium]|uniref:histidine kinase n=1 Tax=Aromatoleum anaerobium TaxID=182180 RepID=A0ABX1PNC1_9RHOO|nr:Hpt domain-containing protein [Aromatoleum anaerobium]MCK0509430.1 Hpt domain-containing protein [Aromatoleum anaerobium]